MIVGINPDPANRDRSNYAKLRNIKAKYDRGNLFRVNQNIAPAEAGATAV